VGGHKTPLGPLTSGAFIRDRVTFDGIVRV